MAERTLLNLVNDDIDVNTLTAAGNISGPLVGDGSSLTNLVLSAANAHARASLFSDGTINGSTTFTSKNVFPVTGSLSVNTGGYTSSSSGIVVPADGYYLIFTSVRQDSTVQRSSVQIAFTINSIVQSEIGSSGYIRSGSGHNESSAHLSTIYNLTAGDEIGLAFRRDPDGQQGNTGTVNLIGTSQVSIYHIRA